MMSNVTCVTIKNMRFDDASASYRVRVCHLVYLMPIPQFQTFKLNNRPTPYNLTFSYVSTVNMFLVISLLMLRSCLSSTFLQLVHGCSAWMVSANESRAIAEQCCHSIVILKALVFRTV